MSYAFFLKRIYAFLLDYLVIVLYGVFFVASMSFLFGETIQPLFSHSPIKAELTGFLMMTLPVSLYFILCERSKWQGTLGKRIFKIRVVSNAGQRIGISRSIIRTVIKFLPWELAHFSIWHLMLPSNMSENTAIILLNVVNLAIIIYLITPFMNKKRKNVYDWLAGTIVID